MKKPAKKTNANSKAKKKKGWFQRKPVRQDVSIVQNVKEPFSWDRFVDEKIVGNWKAFTRYLDRKGILYLLMSPFRYRTRLLFRLWVIFFCILLGIVPRTFTLVRETKAQYRATELVQLKDKVFPDGNFSIKPLMSSHKDGVHVLAFNLVGESNAGVSSLTADYDVRVLPGTGISQPDTIRYQYHIFPFDAKQRLLVVKIDASQNTRKKGQLQLWINPKGEDVLKEPLMINISSQQEESPLYDGTLHLPALSRLMSSTSKQSPIQEAQENLDKALHVYQIEYARLKTMGTQMVLSPDDLTRYAKSHTTYPEITDQSTTAVAEAKPMKTLPALPSPQVAIQIGDQTLTEKDYQKKGQNGEQALDKKTVDDMTTTIEVTRKVLESLTALNQARLTKYTELYNLARALTETVADHSFTDPVSISEVKTPHVTK